MQQQIRHIGVAGTEQQICVRVEHAVEDTLGDLRTGGGEARKVDVVCRPADKQCDRQHNHKVQNPLARAVFIHFKRGELPVKRLLQHGDFVFLFHLAASFQLSFLRRYSLKKSMMTTTTNSDSSTVPRLL